MRSPHSDSRIPGSALLLGLGGAIPFAAGALAPAFGIDQVLGIGVTAAVLAYGAVILSFLGGIRWGLAVGRPEDLALRLTVSVVPSLVAWAAVLLGGRAGLGLLAVAFAAQGWLDARGFAMPPVPAWYVKLRLALSVIVVGLIAIAFSFATRHGTVAFTAPPAFVPPAIAAAPLSTLPPGHPPLVPGERPGPTRPGRDI